MLARRARACSCAPGAVCGRSGCCATPSTRSRRRGFSASTVRSCTRRSGRSRPRRSPLDMASPASRFRRCADVSGFRNRRAATGRRRLQVAGRPHGPSFRSSTRRRRWTNTDRADTFACAATDAVGTSARIGPRTDQVPAPQVLESVRGTAVGGAGRAPLEFAVRQIRRRCDRRVRAPRKAFHQCPAVVAFPDRCAGLRVVVRGAPEHPATADTFPIRKQRANAVLSDRHGALPHGARHGFQREPGAWTAGRQCLQRPLRDGLLPPAVPVQRSRRLSGGKAAIRQRLQRRRLGRAAPAGD